MLARDRVGRIIKAETKVVVAGIFWSCAMLEYFQKHKLLAALALSLIGAAIALACAVSTAGILATIGWIIFGIFAIATLLLAKLLLVMRSAEKTTEVKTCSRLIGESLGVFGFSEEDFKVAFESGNCERLVFLRKGAIIRLDADLWNYPDSEYLLYVPYANINRVTRLEPQNGSQASKITIKTRLETKGNRVYSLSDKRLVSGKELSELKEWLENEEVPALREFNPKLIGKLDAAFKNAGLKVEVVKGQQQEPRR